MSVYNSERFRKWWAANKERQNKLQRQRYTRRRDVLLANARRDYRKYEAAKKAKVYGMRKEEVARWLLIKHCQICGAGDRELTLDHNHRTGPIRGRLCHPCNRGLGFFKDNPDTLKKAITYLRDRQEKKL